MVRLKSNIAMKFLSKLIRAKSYSRSYYHLLPSISSITRLPSITALL